MDKHYLYYYECEYWDNHFEETKIDRGIVAGADYGDAAARVTDLYKDPSTKETNIIAMYFYEVDSYDGNGVIEEDTLKEIFEQKSKLRCNKCCS